MPDRDSIPVAAHNLAAALSELPLFPLPEVVLFPRAQLPLHVFEPRYRAMLRDALATHGAIGVVQLAEGSQPSDDRPRIAPVAGAGLVIEHSPLPDGRSNIVLLGMARVRLDELAYEAPYRRARATILEDEDAIVEDADITALIQVATSFATEVKKRDPRFSFRLPASIAPGTLADLCAYHLVISGHERQTILEELDPERRVRLVLDAISTQRLELGAGDGPASVN